jgi:NADH:ubiquinone oxidoreductase subunit F (NADH-binding)
MEPDASIDASPAVPAYSTWSRVRGSMPPETVIDTIGDAGLVGKGGAGFPTHRKMRLLFDQPGKKKYVVLNGSEHEPGSVKDRYLLEQYPQTVLEGALILAYAVRASNVIVAINDTMTVCIEHFEGALRAARDAAVDFAGITVEMRAVPDVYIVGEETALLEVLEGRQALPRKKPPYPIEKGIHGVPTLIQNIETAAHIPFILSAGPRAYRALGVNGKGVTLCTLGLEFKRPGVYEVPLGTPIRELLDGWGGGLQDGSPIKAIQPGGPSSGFLASGDFDLPLDAEVLKQHGAALGCAAIRAYSADTCMVAEISRIMHFFAHGSCGQCPRCRMETNMLDTVVRRVLTGGGNWQLLGQVDKLIELSKGEGRCSLIDMPVAPIKTGLTLFSDEFRAHIEGGCGLCAARVVPAVNVH